MSCGLLELIWVGREEGAYYNAVVLDCYQRELYELCRPLKSAHIAIARLAVARLISSSNPRIWRRRSFEVTPQTAASGEATLRFGATAGCRDP
jgi:hypothetical protein